MDDVRIVPTAEQYADGFHAAIDIVARERRYIGFVEGPPIESTRQFVRRILDGAGVQMLAVTPADAVALYVSLGFVIEGVKRRVRKLDGEFDDNVMMALLDDLKEPPVTV